MFIPYAFEEAKLYFAQVQILANRKAAKYIGHYRTNALKAPFHTMTLDQSATVLIINNAESTREEKGRLEGVRTVEGANAIFQLST